ncbi:HEAT repeat domain-containing protein [Pelagibius sp. Alg239-R121]|uniref:HEAT repeat domain-containing protein n=1 Tax=Pelagibius sp. Alg239-R121 TaxID=2993448 RepID=UPI0024A6A70D|nr:HEAT repeat domain-containing protein [Pelagibius sp. Alg239-R121]
MATLSDELALQLESECGHTYEEIVARKSVEDYRQLRSVVQDDKEDIKRRQSAIHLLGRFGKNEVVPDIVAAIPRLDERGLIGAVDALGQLGGKEALKALKRQAKSKSADVRRFAVSALDRIGTKEALTEITKIARADESGFVRTKARRLLKRRAEK